MKSMASKNPKQNTQFNTNRHKPENKDNLDSREGEEQLLKGKIAPITARSGKTGKVKKESKTDSVLII